MNLIANSWLESANKKGEPLLIRLFCHLLEQLTNSIKDPQFNCHTLIKYVTSHSKTKGVQLHPALIKLVTEWPFSMNYDSKDSKEFVTNLHIGNLYSL